MVFLYTERRNVTSRPHLCIQVTEQKEMGHWVARGESSGKQGQNAISFFYRTLMALGMDGQISCHWQYNGGCAFPPACVCGWVEEGVGDGICVRLHMGTQLGKENLLETYIICVYHFSILIPSSSLSTVSQLKLSNHENHLTACHVQLW